MKGDFEFYKEEATDLKEAEFISLDEYFSLMTRIEEYFEEEEVTTKEFEDKVEAYVFVKECLWDRVKNDADNIELMEAYINWCKIVDEVVEEEIENDHI